MELKINLAHMSLLALIRLHFKKSTSYYYYYYYLAHFTDHYQNILTFHLPSMVRARSTSSAASFKTHLIIWYRLLTISYQ